MQEQTVIPYVNEKQEMIYMTDRDWKFTVEELDI